MRPKCLRAQISGTMWRVSPINVGWGENSHAGMSCGETTHLESYRLNRSMIFSSSSSARDRS